MKKFIITIVLAVCSFQVGFSQYDEVTESKIKVKFFAAQELLEKSEYSKAIDKVKEIEALTGGPKLSAVQNIKVKSYLGLGRYKEAKEQLNTLYKLSPTDEVIKDIASYESKIDEGIVEEQANIEKARLAKIEREEADRLAAIKREEDAKLAEIKRKEDARLAEIRKNQYQEDLKIQEKQKRIAIFKEKSKRDDDVILAYKMELFSEQCHKPYTKPSEYIYFNSDGEVELIIPSDSKFFDENYYYSIDPFYNGYAVITRNEDRYWHDGGKGIKRGLINKKGELIIPFLYDIIGRMGDGLINVGNYTGEVKKSRKYVDTYFMKWGYIDINGSIIVPLMYEDASPFSEGLAEVKNGKIGYINKNGIVVIPFKYGCRSSNMLGNFKNGKARVGVNCKKFIYINTNGEKVD